jgi:hypothetical protein
MLKLPAIARLRPRFFLPVQQHHLGLVLRQPAPQVRLRQQHRHLRVVQQVRQPRRRILRVQRHVRPARLENAQKPRHHRQRPLHADPHPHLRPHPQGAQMVRQPVGLRVQLRVRPLLLLKDHSNGVGAALHLRLEQLVHAHALRVGRRRLVPLHQQLPTLPPVQRVNVAQPAIRIRRH